MQGYLIMILLFYSIIVTVLLIWNCRKINKIKKEYNADSAEFWERKYSELFDQHIATTVGKAQAEKLSDMNEIYLRNFVGRYKTPDADAVNRMNGKFKSGNGKSKKENEIAAYKMALSGYSKEDIADALQISPGSVKTYVNEGRKQSKGSVIGLKENPDGSYEVLHDDENET